MVVLTVILSQEDGPTVAPFFSVSLNTAGILTLFP